MGQKLKLHMLTLQEKRSQRVKELEAAREAQLNDKDKITIQVNNFTWIRIRKGNDPEEAIKRFKRVHKWDE